MIFDPLIASVIAQVAATPAPQTGNSKLDSLVYVLTGLLGLRGGADILDRVRRKRSAPAPQPPQIDSKKLEEVAETLEKIVALHGQTVEATKDMANTIDKMSVDLQDVRVRLAGIQGRLGATN